MGIFKSNKSDLTAGPDIPVSQVSAMKQQGYSNNQIIQTLQRDGYNSSQIFDAISQSEMASGSQQNTDVNPQTAQIGQQLPPLAPMQSVPTMGLQSSPEELIETIIDEKWNELVKDINKVIEWKQKADGKIAMMEQQMSDMQTQFDKLHQAIIGKVGDYDRHILEVGTQLQAMEKVFGKVLPTFIDNVSELGAITQKIKYFDNAGRVEKKNVKKKKAEDD
jgi:hypothetical protein